MASEQQVPWSLPCATWGAWLPTTPPAIAGVLVPGPHVPVGIPPLAAPYMTSLAPGACFLSPSQLASRDPRPQAEEASVVSTSLQRGVARAMGRWEDDTNLRRERAALELGRWMACLPSSWGVGWKTVTPELMLAYYEGHWLPAHGTRQLPDGTPATAPSTLDGVLSHHRTTFRLLGRVNEWGTAPAEFCNPADSIIINSYVSAFRKQCAQAGYEAIAAKPFQPTKLKALLDQLDAKPSCEPGLASLLQARDQAVLCFMFETGRRAKDTGRLRWCDLLLPDGKSLDPGTWEPTEGDVIHCKMFSKTHKTAREGAGCFIYHTAGDDRSTSFLWRLHQYVLLRRASQLGWGAGGWVFSPQSRNKRALQDSPYASDACCKRLNTHLAQCGLDDGETPHGLRRGLAQTLDGAGVSAEVAMATLGMRSQKTFDLYRSTDRPTRGRPPL